MEVNYNILCIGLEGLGEGKEYDQNIFKFKINKNNIKDLLQLKKGIK